MIGNVPAYKVLVVDDGEMIRQLIITILSKQGQHCETASNGFEALDKANYYRLQPVVVCFL